MSLPDWLLVIGTAAFVTSVIYLSRRHGLERMETEMLSVPMALWIGFGIRFERASWLGRTK